MERIFISFIEYHFSREYLMVFIYNYTFNIFGVKI